MKKTTALVFLVILSLFLTNTGCIMDGYIESPYNLEYEIVSGQDGKPGGGIKLTWTPYEVSDSVGISVDGVQVAAVTSNEAYVYTPGAEVEVYTIVGKERSASRVLDFASTETPTLEVYSVDDPSTDHPSGFGFDANGIASTYAVSNESNWPSIDYYIASGPKLAAPSDHLPDPINSEENASSAETGTYDALKIVSPTDKNLYLTNRDLVAGGLYGLWLDDNGTYDAGDLFGKAVVGGIDGYKVTFKFALQTKAGLRWVVVE